MDLACKLIIGSGLQEEPPSLPQFSYRGVCTEIFSTFLFFAQRGGMGRVRDGGGWGHGLCPPCTSTNAVSVFSLSLSRACTPASTRHPGLSHAGGPAEDDGPLRLFPLRRGHQHAALPPTRLPHHRLLLPSPLGPQCLGRGEPVETVPCPRLPPQKRQHHTTSRSTPPPHTEDSGGQRGTLPAGPPRLQLY